MRKRGRAPILVGLVLLAPLVLLLGAHHLFTVGLNMRSPFAAVFLGLTAGGVACLVGGAWIELRRRVRRSGRKP